MTISISWWAMPVLAMVASMYFGLRLFKADLIGFGLTLMVSLAMGVFATLLTLAVWGIAR